jgi:hypothetical protein
VIGPSRIRRGGVPPVERVALAPHEDPIFRHTVIAEGDLPSWLRPENVVPTGPRLAESGDIESWIDAVVSRWRKHHGPIPKKELMPHEIAATWPAAKQNQNV